jgi:four helix bundle protein
MMIASYRDLIVWQKAMDFADEVYKLTKLFPKEELYSLTNQVRRAAVSVPSNIAEGKDRHAIAEYLHFLSIAKGSLAEVETQLLLAIRFGYISKAQSEKVFELREEISRMLVALRSKLITLKPVTCHLKPKH